MATMKRAVEMRMLDGHRPARYGSVCLLHKYRRPRGTLRQSSIMDAIEHASLEELQLAEEVGPKVAEAVVQYFSEPGNRELVGRLRQAGLQFFYTSTRLKAGGPLQGKTLVITGTLPTLSRDEAKRLIEQAGGKVSGAVSRKTSFVVVGEDAGR